MKIGKYSLRKMAILCLSILVLTVSGCQQSPEAKSGRFLEMGKALLKKHDINRAILQFRNAIQTLPNNAEAYYQLGLAYSAAQDYRSAVAAFLKATEINPKHPGARLRIAQMKADTNNSELLKEAESELEAWMNDNGAQPEVLNTLALAELKLGNPVEAGQTAELALTKFPPELSPFVMLAQSELAGKDFKAAEATLKKACTSLPKSADAHRLLAEFYLAQKRFAEAEPELRWALSLAPSNGHALNDLARLQFAQGKKQDAEQSFRQLANFEGYKYIYGVFLFQVGRYEEGIRELQRQLRDNPDDRRVRTYLLTAYRKLNRGNDIDRVLGDALQKNPQDIEALLQQSEIFLEKGKYDQAEANLNVVAKLNPTMPEVHYFHGHIYKARGLTGLYRQELGEALRLSRALLAVRLELAQDLIQHGDGQAALAILDEALPSQKSTVPFLIARNWALWTKGDLTEMRKGIDAGLAQERNPELLIQDGLWKFRSGNPAAAQAALQEVLKIDPTNLFALQALNNTYTSQNNSSTALEKVKQYAARVPQSAPAQNFLGQLLIANGDRSQARTVLTSARAASPEAVELDLSLAQLDYMDNQLDNARHRLQNVLSTHPENSVARLWLGVVDFQLGDHQAAIDHFRKVLDSNPEDALAGNDLAYELAEHTNRLDDALKYAQKAVQLAPNQPAFADTLGWVLYRKGLYASAVPYLEQASKDGKNALARYHLAMAYAKAGNRSHSITTLEAALKLDPNLPEAKAAQDVVRGTQ